MADALVADSPLSPSKATEPAQDKHDQPSFVPPRLAPVRARSRHRPLHGREALKVLSRASTPGTEELPPRYVPGVVCVVRSQGIRYGGGCFWRNKVTPMHRDAGWRRDPPPVGSLVFPTRCCAAAPDYIFFRWHAALTGKLFSWD